MLYNKNMMPPDITKEELTLIGSYILEGMTEEQSCILAEFSFARLQHEKEKNEIVRKFIEKRKTEFKYNHIKEIQKNRSEKNSQWLLEKLYPEEFGPKPRGQGEGGPTINIISAMIKDIQNDNQENIVTTRGTRSIKEGETNKDDQNRIRVAEVLNGE